MAALPDAGKGVGAHREDGTKEKSQAATLPPAIPASIARNAPLTISFAFEKLRAVREFSLAAGASPQWPRPVSMRRQRCCSQRRG